MRTNFFIDGRSIHALDADTPVCHVMALHG